MALKDVICKEYKYSEVIPYQLRAITMGKIEFFVPMSFECVDKDNVRLCYDVSGMDRIGIITDGSEAPYLASMLIKGMRDAMDYYIFPSQYLLREKVIYKLKNGSIKVAYVPEIMGEMPLKDPARTMRKLAFSLLVEFFDADQRGKIPSGSKCQRPEIPEETMAILSDNSIGMDTCMRKIEKAKEGVLIYQTDSYRIDHVNGVGIWK